MVCTKDNKIARVLGIYTKLINGYTVKKDEEALIHNVNERSIQRDIDDIRAFFEDDALDKGLFNSVIYDRAEKGYRLERIYKERLTNSEILAICKILLDSRSLTKDEMMNILRKLIECCVPEVNQQVVTELIQNEAFHYVEPHHKTVFIDKMWDIGQAIKECRLIEIDYERVKDKAVVTRVVKPAAIMFSEYYFYLTAFIDDEKVKEGFEVKGDVFPTIYRIDRIKALRVSNEHFHIPYSSRFEEGEFRKRVQFMYGGKLQKIKFRYYGNDLNAILDRLPTAQVISEDDGVFTLCAEIFGKGIDMWIRSQGDLIQVL